MFIANRGRGSPGGPYWSRPPALPLTQFGWVPLRTGHDSIILERELSRRAAGIQRHETDWVRVAHGGKGGPTFELVTFRFA